MPMPIPHAIPWCHGIPDLHQCPKRQSQNPMMPTITEGLADSPVDLPLPLMSTVLDERVFGAKDSNSFEHESGDLTWR